MKLSDYIFNEAYLNSNHVIRTLKELYKNHDKSMIFIGGSVSRLEALPMSDIDLVSIGDSPKIDKSTFNDKKFDRIDNLNIHNVNQAQRMLDCMSPEGGFIDSIPITEINNPFYNHFNSRPYLINKLIYEYFNSRLFNDRTNKDGYNLKYTPGGYRDILIINICSRIFNHNTNRDCPEIQFSISNLKKNITYKGNYSEILNDIAFVMFTKTLILSSFRDSTSRGFTQLNQSTLETAFNTNNEFVSVMPKSIKQFWSQYYHAKKSIRNFVDETLENIMGQFKNNIWEETKNYLYVINAKNTEGLANDFFQSDFFPILSALIQGNLIGHERIHELAVRFHKDCGHYYTNRLIAKSRVVSVSTLKYMITNSRFALDDYTNTRYIRIIEQKINNEIQSNNFKHSTQFS